MLNTLISYLTNPIVVGAIILYTSHEVSDRLTRRIIILVMAVIGLIAVVGLPS